ncbi:uncharacterized protein EDB91DRAFT_1245042 [Suillus paluster]|uniref:uncharacterized protein n=1 Tax=Suillus paluster TaxID=48578 RepID=UPI001B879894|nr:uncharacterized protein EDB91DRAFT_1245042 [Suillus paluster]KAG1748334.1 hypothetical protein EDB91DRAFT_1245042 [Suillus paluster]
MNDGKPCSSSQTDPLPVVPRESSHRHQYLKNWTCTPFTAVAVAFVVVIFALVFSPKPCNNPLGSDVRDIELLPHQHEVLKRVDTQARWRLEDDERNCLRKQWGWEVEKHNLEQWGREVEEHERDVADEVLKRIDTQVRWRLEDDERNRLREQWGCEVEKHKQEVEETRKREEEERIRLREQWGREVEEHKNDMAERQKREGKERIRLRKQWEREEEEHKRVVERRKREEEKLLRSNMFWSNLQSHTCTAYATREYTARLVNIPSYYNRRRIEACMAMPVQIHGVEYTPKWCEDHGLNNVTGHWEVNQNQPDCASYWDSYKDFGCDSPGSGQRRIEHRLANLPSRGDWKEFCATTPVSFRGMHFKGAQSCFQTTFGVRGHWVIDDQSCN